MFDHEWPFSIVDQYIKTVTVTIITRVQFGFDKNKM